MERASCQAIGRRNSSRHPSTRQVLPSLRKPTRETVRWVECDSASILIYVTTLCVLSTMFASPAQLLIVAPEQADVNEADDPAGGREAQTCPKGRWIMWSLLGDEYIARHKICAVSQSQDYGCSNCHARTPTQVVRQPRCCHGHLDEGSRTHAEQAEIPYGSRYISLLGI
jgi:hypothetical protein